MISRILFYIALILVVFKSMHIPTELSHLIGPLPVLHDGRVKPIDTVARHYLLTLQGRLKLVDKNEPALWFFNLVTNQEYGNSMPLLLVENPKLFETLGSQYRKQKFRVSADFMIDNGQLIHPFVTSAQRLEKQERTAMQQSAFVLAQRFSEFESLKNSFFPYHEKSQLKFWNTMLDLTQSFTPNDIQNSSSFPTFLYYYDQLNQFDSPIRFVFGESWATLPQAALEPTDQNKQILSNYLLLADAFQNKNMELIKSYSDAIQSDAKNISLSMYLLTQLEYYFNVINPFIGSLFCYLLILLTCFITRFFNLRTGQSLIHHTWVVGLTLHTFGLIARIVILNRPPVINLYSSAIFIAYILSLIGFLMYRRRQVLFYAGTTSVSAALSLIVAYHLSLTGDTLTVMQAVLNSNFWLATHVVAMTIGYAIIFLAGFFAITYILMGTLTRLLTKDLEQQISTLVYVFLMISLFFNFVGTVLGGIWADQSWGRFWGWDPKENGAILIVLWTAIILHMKWGKLLTNKRLMIMAVASNMVTAWSWKGTNMLGIGLHSYGFTEATFYWLMMFFVSQLAIMLLGAMPEKYWLSFLSSNNK